MKGRQKVVRRFRARQGLYALFATLLFCTASLLLIILGYVRVD